VTLAGFGQQQGTGEQEGASQCGGLLFLVWPAGAEGDAVDLLDFGELVVEEQVSEFVGDVAGEPACGPERVGDDEVPVVDLEGGGGEGERLECLELLEACHAD